MEDKYNVFLEARLEAIKSIVKGNSRNIADNSIKLDLLSDEVKKDVKDILESIIDTQNNINTLIALNKEQKKDNKELKLLCEDMIQSQKEMRKELDRALYKDTEPDYLKSGVM